jgi:hypothetical protein
MAEFEEEIDALSVDSQIDRSTLVRNMWEILGKEAASVWQTGRLPRLHEAPFLLAFLRQLSAQGWTVKEGISLSCSEAARVRLRELRDHGSIAGAPCERGLAGQSIDQCADPLHLLSSILARHAQATWSDAYTAYAEIGFPLTTRALARVGRLRGYGNALNAEAARVFIEAVMR